MKNGKKRNINAHKSYDVKIYEDKGILKGSGLHNLEEKETIRRLTYSQMTALVSVLKRHGIKYYVKEY